MLVFTTWTEEKHSFKIMNILSELNVQLSVKYLFLQHY